VLCSKQEAKHLDRTRGQAKNGFLVADVFADGILDTPAIQFFIRKVQMLRASSNSGDTLPLLVAEGFTGKALTAGHAAGVVLATPANLFGQKVGAAIQSLVETLKNAAAVAAANPERLAKLVDELSEIEGAAGNLRGVLFELIAAYLARLDAVSVDVGVTARDLDTGKMATLTSSRCEAEPNALVSNARASSPAEWWLWMKSTTGCGASLRSARI